MNVARKAKQEEFDEADYDPDLLELKRRAEEAGVKVQIPKRGGGTWIEPEPLPIDADEMSRFVVELRRSGRL